jgi:hypothetical protein
LDPLSIFFDALDVYFLMPYFFLEPDASSSQLQEVPEAGRQVASGKALMELRVADVNLMGQQECVQECVRAAIGKALPTSAAQYFLGGTNDTGQHSM